MNRHVIPMCVCLLLSACPKADTVAANAVPDAGLRPRLVSVGPRLVSNQTATPLSVVAEHLVAPAKLHLGAPIERDLDLTITDPRHAWARLPEGLAVGQQTETLVDVTLVGGEGSAMLRVIDDLSFPDLVGFALADDAHGFAVSTTTDIVYSIDLSTHQVRSVQVPDGPSALAIWHTSRGPWVVIAHRYSPQLTLFNANDPSERRSVSAPLQASHVLVDGSVAYVAEHARDTVVAIGLDDGREHWRTPVMPNPRELALTPRGLAVGSLETGAIEWLNPANGEPVGPPVEPGPGVPIVGGTTSKYSAFVMNGKAPRGLAWSARQKALFVASIGPNIGPNPDKMEVSMNGGVGVVDLEKGWQRHLGFGAGVTEALALDDARGVLYASDMGLGLVRVLDVKKLVSPRAAGAALLQEVALPVAASFPLVRPGEDFTQRNRAGTSLHSGPYALALTRDGRTLFVLERFTGMIARLDVSSVGHAEWKEHFPLVNTLSQRGRRLGQVLYYADLGRTAMSCDACHLEGHNEGVLFEKTNPLRIYRSTTVRGSRETPPYFTPASTHSMGETAKVVGARNRYHNPDPTPEEVEALTIFISSLTTPPNPFVSEVGAPVNALTLPDGREGHPLAGLALFEGKAQCASCHPAPHFTIDQDVATRGRFIDVGTPQFMPLREALQNTRFEGFGTPSLVGSWDVFPMLTTGLAGLEVSEGRVRVATRFPLRVAVTGWPSTHGHAELLSAQEVDDLLAYVMSL